MAPKAARTSPLRARREALNLSPVQVAAASGLSPQQIVNLEAGKHMPTLETARRLAAALSAPIDALWPAQQSRESAA